MEVYSPRRFQCYEVLWITQPYRPTGWIQFIVPCIIPHLSWIFNKNLLTHFSVIMLVTNTYYPPKNWKKNLDTGHLEHINLVINYSFNIFLISQKFNQNPYISFSVMSQTDKQTFVNIASLKTLPPNLMMWRCDMAIIGPMQHNKPNIIYLNSHFVFPIFFGVVQNIHNDFCQQ